MRPGEISLAHNGVLFLDELAEFKSSVLQSLRQPLESGRVVLTRADGSVSFPSRFLLVSATNPCPCGYLGDPERECTCTFSQVRQYQARIGGPLVDRISIQIDVRRVDPSNVISSTRGVSSSQLRDGVLRGGVLSGCGVDHVATVKVRADRLRETKHTFRRTRPLRTNAASPTRLGPFSRPWRAQAR